jgi:tellurite resistance protein TehA-like permease
LCLSSTSISLTASIQITTGSDPYWALVAYGLWWLNVVIAFVACFVIPYLVLGVQFPTLKQVSPAMLLPMVAGITIAAGGATLASSDGLSVDQRLPIAMVSYLFLGAAVPLSLSLSSVYIVSLLGMKQRTREQAYREMILCGPWGQGSYALQALGQFLRHNQSTISKYFISSPDALSGEVIGALGSASTLLGFVFWGQGFFWWLFAVFSIVRSWCSKPLNERGICERIFNLSAWSTVFPWVS